MRFHVAAGAPLHLSRNRAREVIEGKVDQRDVDELVEERVRNRTFQRVLLQVEICDTPKYAVVTIGGCIARVNASNTMPLGVPRAGFLVVASETRRLFGLRRDIRPTLSNAIVKRGGTLRRRIHVPVGVHLPCGSVCGVVEGLQLRQLRHTKRRIAQRDAQEQEPP